VLLAEVPLDGAEFEGGPQAAAHHAMPGGVDVLQVLQPPVVLEVAPVITARDATLSRPRGRDLTMVSVFPA
jgi:hypothetical protein